MQVLGQAKQTKEAVLLKEAAEAPDLGQAAALGQSAELMGQTSADAVAKAGVSGAGGAVPHQTQMQAAFGTSFANVQAHTGPQATAACDALGAEAYAMGNAVAFRDPNPGAGLVAHELTHTLQTGDAGGDQVQRKATGQADTGALEAQADRIGDQVAAGQAVNEPILRGGGLLFKLREIGRIKYSVSFTGAKGNVAVRSRSVSEWKTFLKNDADEVAGGVEMATFMGQAVGQKSINGLGAKQTYTGRAPTEKEAVDLMEAFLSVGGQIDLPDWGTEGGAESRSAMARLMSAFNAKYTAQAVTRMSKAKPSFGNTEIDGVKAYAEDAADMPGQAGYGQRKNPVHSLIAASVGTAFGAASVIAGIGAKPKSDADNTKKAESFKLIGNSAKVVAAALEQAAADRDTQKTILVTAFKAAAGVAGVVTGGTAAIVLGALTPIAEEFLGQLLSGDGKKAARKLKSDFTTKVHNELVLKHKMDASDAQIVDNTFSTNMNF